jgi:hypothetical protein
MTPSIITLSITAFGIMKLSVMTHGVMILCKMSRGITVTRRNDPRQNVTQNVGEKVLLCVSTECRNLTARMSVVRLIVAAPFFPLQKITYHQHKTLFTFKTMTYKARDVLLKGKAQYS